MKVNFQLQMHCNHESSHSSHLQRKLIPNAMRLKYFSAEVVSVQEFSFDIVLRPSFVTVTRK